ncbi:MAG: nucleotidyltransferase domain-containing protein [Lachnospiraceae bacterium]|nr:nucleotidyltransferase domain-containing protein [Lachnospiraceae bacterium]
MANLTIDEILEQVESLCRKYEVEHLYLFGSHANGTATGPSDIDIVIKGGVRIFDLKEEIDRIPTLKKIDVFEYDKCKNKYLKEDMDRYGRKSY